MAMPSFLSTVTVASLWATAGNDLWTFIQIPFYLAVGVATGFALIGVARKYLGKAVGALRRG